MAEDSRGFILPDVPPMNRDEHPDNFLEALSIAVSYESDGLKDRFPMGVYPHLSGYTGRGWLIGFDDTGYYWEKYRIENPDPAFAVSGLQANLEHHETLREAVTYLGYTPKFLWNVESRYHADPDLAAPFVSAAGTVARPAIRQYVVDYLTTRRKPLVCFLHSPQAEFVGTVLLTGFELDGGAVFGRSPYYGVAGDSPEHPHGYFRLVDWERDVVAILGLGEATTVKSKYHPCYTTIENALKYSESYTRGTKHYGLSAYDAWETALLDDDRIAGADDHAVSRYLLYHSSIAGNTACQKAFTAFPDYWNAVPSMGVISGLLQRAVAGPQIIHGLMWDVWQVVGGYWRGAKPGDAEVRVRWDNDEEIRRFRDRAVRERAVEVIRRARRTDEQAIAELREAKADWDKCRGHGSSHPCPCWDKPCIRV